MDIEDDDDFGGFNLVKKGRKSMNLSATTQKYVQEKAEQAKINVLLNGHLDPRNQANRAFLQMNFSNIKFQSFLLKNKNKDQRRQVFDALRDRLETIGINDVKRVSDKLPEQVMIVRIIQKVENALNAFVIEDQLSKEKMQVKEGTVWVGMICAVSVEWADNIYRLKKVIDLSQQIPPTTARLASNISAYRCMFVKGPFRPNFNTEDKGVGIIAKYMQQLKTQSRITIDCLVVMGPLLSKNHKSVKDFSLQTRVEEQYEKIVNVLKVEVSKIHPEIQIYILPSLDDIVSIYPIPQPSYNPQQKEAHVQYLSNPSILSLRGMKSQYKVDLINYDILKYIDTFRGGKATKDLRQENFQTYLKQPFYLCNTKDPQEPFDEVNFSGLYNDGNFGDLVVFSSTFSPPFINKIDGRIVLNIGSLGVDFNETGNHYMTIASIYEGEGMVSERIKIETITM